MSWVEGTEKCVLVLTRNLCCRLFHTCFSLVRFWLCSQINIHNLAFLLPSSPAAAAQVLLSLTHRTKQSPYEQSNLQFCCLLRRLPPRQVSLPQGRWDSQRVHERSWSKGPSCWQHCRPLSLLIRCLTLPENVAEDQKKLSQEGEGRRYSSLNLLPLSSTWRSRLLLEIGNAVAITQSSPLHKTCLCFLICCVDLSDFYFQGASVLISWLQSRSAVILESKKMKSVTVSTFHPSICHEVIGADAKIVFWMLGLKPAFSLSSFAFIKRLFSFSLLSVISVVSSAYLRLLIFLLQSWF